MPPTPDRWLFRESPCIPWTRSSIPFPPSAPRCSLADAPRGPHLLAPRCSLTSAPRCHPPLPLGAGRRELRGAPPAHAPARLAQRLVYPPCALVLAGGRSSVSACVRPSALAYVHPAATAGVTPRYPPAPAPKCSSGGWSVALASACIHVARAATPLNPRSWTPPRIPFPPRITSHGMGVLVPTGWRMRSSARSRMRPGARLRMHLGARPVTTDRADPKPPYRPPPRPASSSATGLPLLALAAPHTGAGGRRHD